MFLGVVLGEGAGCGGGNGDVVSSGDTGVDAPVGAGQWLRVPGWSIGCPASRRVVGPCRSWWPTT